jgi:hypothetical protein
MRDRTGLFCFLVKPLLAVVLVAGVFAVLALRTRITTLEYSIASVERQRQGELTYRKGLVAELARLRSIEQVGERHAALNVPDRERVYYVVRDTREVPVAAYMRDVR